MMCRTLPAEVVGVARGNIANFGGKKAKPFTKKSGKGGKKSGKSKKGRC